MDRRVRRAPLDLVSPETFPSGVLHPVYPRAQRAEGSEEPACDRPPAHIGGSSAHGRASRAHRQRHERTSSE